MAKKIIGFIGDVWRVRFQYDQEIYYVLAADVDEAISTARLRGSQLNERSYRSKKVVAVKRLGDAYCES